MLTLFGNIVVPHFTYLYMRKPTIHIGEKIRLKAKELKIGPTEIGRRIDSTKQNVLGIFKRESVDTNLLKKISIALHYDFFTYYIEDSSVSLLMERPVYYGTSTKPKSITKVIEEKDKMIEEQETEINKLKDELKNQQIAYLKKINEILEKKWGKP